MRLSLVICFISISILSTHLLLAQKSSIDSKSLISSKNGLHPEAPQETKILSQLFGLWDAYQVSRNKDGSWASDTSHYEWHWYPILDGHAIQDDWIKLEKTKPTGSKRQVVGTNIRIYNWDENQWNMAWIDKNNRKLASFTAINVNNTVIISGVNALGRPVRNTFFNFEEDIFDWKQEWTFDGGKNWVTVSKIHCKRKE